MRAFTFFILTVSTACFGQKNEFPIYDNGLIYSPTTMHKLSEIVDSLNLKFRTCDLSHPYRSIEQGLATVVSIPNEFARKEIKAGSSLEVYMSKYMSNPRKIWVLKRKTSNYKNEEIIRYEALPNGFHSRPTVDVKMSKFNDKSHGWIVSEGDQAFFLEGLSTTEIPTEYARWIQYVDCMIDTTVDVMLPNAKDDWNGKFGQQLETSNLRDEKRLEILRSHRVIGMCSQDQRPRMHAINICLLSAETAKWDIFLRSHLNIMNDRFERVSDGSYAWGSRKTYLKELEELDINAVDLLIGTSLRSLDVSDGHYLSSINRVGRALSDVTDRDELETRLQKMIEDDKLDPFNRLLIAYTFSNYIANLPQSDQPQVKIKLDKSIDMLPQLVKDVWDQE